MSISSIQNELNNVERDISSEERKRAAADKRVSELEGKVLAVNKTINKNTTASTLASKMRQIEGYQKEAARKRNESADCSRKIASLGEKRLAITKRLQKAENDEKKKQVTSSMKMQASYEKKIRELSEQVSTPALISTLKVENANSVTSGDDEFDVFISHAWEDKESFVDDFVSELELLGVKVWYDKKRIGWGDSMRARIDEGLRKSKFGIVVISPNYIADGKYWTKTELDGLFQLESVNGKTILPIWHGITKQEVMNYSPIIAAKLAMNTSSMTPGEIAAEMRKVLHGQESED